MYNSKCLYDMGFLEYKIGTKDLDGFFSNHMNNNTDRPFALKALLESAYVLSQTEGCQDIVKLMTERIIQFMADIPEKHGVKQCGNIRYSCVGLISDTSVGRENIIMPATPFTPKDTGENALQKKDIYRALSHHASPLTKHQILTTLGFDVRKMPNCLSSLMINMEKTAKRYRQNQLLHIEITTLQKNCVSCAIL